MQGIIYLMSESEYKGWLNVWRWTGADRALAGSITAGHLILGLNSLQDKFNKRFCVCKRVAVVVKCPKCQTSLTSKVTSSNNK